MQKEIASQIQKLLNNGIIRPSISPYSSPVWIVPKKADASGKKKFRMVIDYRKLNENTIEDKYPLPRIDEILDNLGRCTYFTTLDLAQGFHQIEMHPDSIEKTAFTVNNGHYEYVRMPFGLRNAPSTFQRVMDNVLREHLHRICFVYMDDIVIFSKSLQEHMTHIKSIFSKLREFNLKVQLDKSEFACKSVAFLGHIITDKGIKPNPSKIEAIQKFPIPKNIKEIKSFLGLVGYYRRFISNFAKIVQPMTKCLKKGTKIETNNPEYQSAFQKCKQIITNAPVLQYPDFNKPFCLTTDASNVALGGVLSQSGKPIAFYSRTLNSAEKNYSTIEKELLSIIENCKHFRPYLFGRKFTVKTDHNPLVWLSKLKEPNSRLTRWRLKLEEYDFDVIYKKGLENKVADALSRIEINTKESVTLPSDDTESLYPNISENPPEISDEEIDQLLNTAEDVEINPEDMEDIIKLIDSNTLSPKPSTSRSNDSDVTQKQPLQKHCQQVQQIQTSDETAHSVSHDTEGKIIPISELPVNYSANRIIINTGEQFSYRSKSLRLHKKITTHTVIVRQNNLQEDLQKVLIELTNPEIINGIFFSTEQSEKVFINLVKEQLRPNIKIQIHKTKVEDVDEINTQRQIVQNYHDANHNGITETLEQLKSKYYWPAMRKTISNYINKCETCLSSKYERHPYKVPLQGPIITTKPFERIHIDTLIMQGHKFLTLIDHFTKYAQAYSIPDRNATTIVSKLSHYCSHHGFPKEIVCDTASEFTGEVMKDFCKIHNIILHKTTSENPNSNAPVERLHSTLVEKMKVLRDSPNSVVDKMAEIITVYNQSIHSTTGKSPFFLLYPLKRDDELIQNSHIYEQYIQDRLNEMNKLYKDVTQRTEQKLTTAIDKKNANRNETPNIQDQNVYILRRTESGKTQGKAVPAVVTRQENTKIFAENQNTGRKITANLAKIRRIRQDPLLQNNPTERYSLRSNAANPTTSNK